MKRLTLLCGLASECDVKSKVDGMSTWYNFCFAYNLTFEANGT